jgi:hypothetical protein
MLLKTPRELLMFEVVAYLVEGQRLETLLALKVEKSVICLVGTRRPTVNLVLENVNKK